MKLFLDPTTDSQLTIGIALGRDFTMKTVAIPRGKHEKVLIEIDRVLQSLHKTPSDVKSIGVVSGPGRFSSLRAASTIANVFAMAQKIDLYAMPNPGGIPIEPAKVFQAANKVSAIQPAYGKPPSITLPKKRAPIRVI